MYSYLLFLLKNSLYKRGVILLCLFLPKDLHSQIKGIISASDTGEKLEGVNIKNVSSKFSIQSNSYGFFSITALEGDTLEFYYYSYKKETVIISSKNKDTNLEIYLTPFENLLHEVKITGTSPILTTETPSKIKLSNKFIKELPFLLGEKDVFKAFQLLPGIQDISEGSTSLSVRGGSKDQNLILLDESVVYNSNHLFGFFSTFNTDAIQYAEIYKGSFPAQYGGRLSSVIDLRMKEGNNEKFEAELGIGLLTSRIMFQGPLKKKTSSFMLSARRTYLDWILTPFLSETEKISYNFSDFNGKFNYKISDNSHFYLSVYSGNDRFLQKNKLPRLNGFLVNKNGLNWGNVTATTRINTILSKKLFQNVTLIYSKYAMEYNESTEQDYLIPARKYKGTLTSSIKDISLKLDYDYFIKSNLSIKWGAMGSYLFFSPRNFEYFSTHRPDTDFSNYTPESQVQEGALYINLRGKTNKLFYETGLRQSFNLALMKTHLEPRLSIGYNYKNFTFTTGYSKMYQYLHLVSNTGQGLPTDIWIPASNTLRPSSSDIISASVSSHLNDKLSVTLETYYKWIKENVEYKNNVSFLGIGQSINGNNNYFLWEDVLQQGKAWNYGYELTLEKSLGKFTAIGGYTLSWSISQFADLNLGKPFYNNHDRRHIFEASGKYTFSPKVAILANYNFSTGNILTLPDGVYFQNNFGSGSYFEVYKGYNTFRTENYHRLDVSLNLKSKRGTWDFSIYNLYNHKNPYMYQITSENNPSTNTLKIYLNRQWLFPILPSVSYQIKI